MNKTIGDYLASIGCKESIAFAMDRSVIKRPWRNDLPIGDSPTPVEFAGRYTFRDDNLHTPADPAQAGVDPALFTAGSLCGHDIPEQHRAEIEAAVRRPENLFGLENHETYVLSGQDILDLQYVKDPMQDLPIWVTRFGLLSGATAPTLVAIAAGSIPPIQSAQNQVLLLAPRGQMAGVFNGGVPAPLSPQEAALRAAVYFALGWKDLRKALQGAGVKVTVDVRHAVLDAFNPIFLAASAAGLIADDGSIRGGEDE